ncbi:MAG TPA: hypothetical protein VHD38_02630 [Candidatus Paceibacterota bacterium]|nr:hypothetical protein [Candidatus Paceibacterota bacterium]
MFRLSSLEEGLALAAATFLLLVLCAVFLSRRRAHSATALVHRSKGWPEEDRNATTRRDGPKWNGWSADSKAPRQTAR